MLCATCGNKLKPSNRFCEHCGTPVPVPTPVQAVEAPKKVEAQPLILDEDANIGEAFARKEKLKPLHTLQLKAWAGWTWLIAKNYGELTITETHLEYNIRKFWATNLWSIISKIFSWGFDWQTSLWVGRGSSDLRAVSNVRIYALDWLAWKAHTLVVVTTGIPAVYFFTAKQLKEVEAFVETLKQATANAKFVTKAGK